MDKEQINKSKKEALSRIGEALYILQRTERGFNDTLTDNDGKSIEPEYNSIFNAIQSLHGKERTIHGKISIIITTL